MDRFAQCTGYTNKTIQEMHVKRSVILTDRFGPEVLSSFYFKGKVSYART